VNIVDSSCWLEYLAGSKVGDLVSSAVEDLGSLIVPSITIYEVFKKLLVEKDEDSALLAVAHMKQGTVVDLDPDLSIYSAKIGREKKLPMADSIIYATAMKYNSILWTQDKHFKDLESVRYFEKEEKAKKARRSTPT
jgi:predicted nucleic acid-binding protein